MDLGGIMLSEISLTEKDRVYDFTYMWNLKNKINTQNRNRLIDTENRERCQIRRGLGGAG